jgi:hypothetical protein
MAMADFTRQYHILDEPWLWMLLPDRISTGIGCPGVMTILSHELVV